MSEGYTRKLGEISQAVKTLEKEVVRLVKNEQEYFIPSFEALEEQIIKNKKTIERLKKELKQNARQAAVKRGLFNREQQVQNVRLSNVEGKIAKLEKIDKEIAQLKW